MRNEAVLPFFKGELEGILLIIITFFQTAKLILIR